MKFEITQQKINLKLVMQLKYDPNVLNTFYNISFGLSDSVINKIV